MADHRSTPSLAAPSRRAQFRALLRNWDARARLASVAARVIAALAGLAVVALAAVALDHARPGGLPRLLIAGMGAMALPACLAAAAVGAVIAWRRAWNPAYLARAAERANRLPHNPLLNAELLSRTPSSAAEACAAQALQAIDSAPRAVSPDRAAGLSRAFTAAVAVAIGWIALFVVTPKPVGPSIARFFGADIPAPRATRIELVRPTSDQAIYVGEPVELVFRVDGRNAPEVLLDLWPDSADPANALTRSCGRLTGDQAGRLWSTTLAPNELTGTIAYRCRAGDAALEGTLEVRPIPSEQSLRLTITPPVYAGSPFELDAPPELDVLAGSRAVVRLVASTEIREPVLVFTGGATARTRMSLVGSASREAEVALPLLESVRYHVEMKDRWGRSATTPERSLSVVADAPPAAAWETPRTGDDAPLDPSRISELRAAASDDVGLSAATLVAQCGEQEMRIELPLPATHPDPWPAGVREVLALPVETIPLSNQHETTVWLEVTDNRQIAGQPAPQSARTAPLRLRRMPGVEAYERDALGRDAGADAPSAGDDVSGESGSGESPAGSGGGATDADGESQVESGAKGDGGDRADDAQAPAGASEPGDSASAEAPDVSDDALDSSDGGVPEREAPPAAEAGDGAPDSASPSVDAPDAASQSNATSLEKEFERRVQEVLREFGDELADAGGAAEAPDPPNVNRREPPTGDDAAERHARDGPTSQESSDEVSPLTDQKRSGPGDSESGDAASQPSSSDTTPERDRGASNAIGRGESSGESSPDDGKRDPTGRGAPTGAAAPSSGRGGSDPKDEADVAGGGADAGGLGVDVPGGRPSDDVDGAADADGATDADGESQVESGAKGDGGPEGASGDPAVSDRDSPSSATGSSLEERARRALEELLNAPDAPLEEELMHAGWTPERQALLLERVRELRALAERAWSAGAPLRWRPERDVGDSAVSPGAPIPGFGRRTQGSLTSDLRAIAPPPEQRVEPSLAALLEAYYEALAARASASQPSGAVSAP